MGIRSGNDENNCWRSFPESFPIADTRTTAARVDSGHIFFPNRFNNVSKSLEKLVNPVTTFTQFFFVKSGKTVGRQWQMNDYFYTRRIREQGHLTG